MTIRECWHVCSKYNPVLWYAYFTDRADTRFLVGKIQHRKHPNDPFQGHPVQECELEFLDAWCYVHEARRQGLIGWMRFTILRVNILCGAMLCR